ncbi:MAG: ABC transporter permease [Bryobacteraceae bacterium]|jgi:predicted permease
MLYHRLKFLAHRTLRRPQAARDLDEEIRAHLALDTQERVDRGEPPGMAEQNARRALGNELLIKEVTRDMWGWMVMERIWRDLLYALRQMKRTPGFAAVAILSLTLGIGANTAIFSVLNAALLRLLPVREPEELFVVRQQAHTTLPQRFSYPMFLRLRDAGSGALGVAAMSHVARAQISLETGAQSEVATYQLVSGEFFGVLGLSPAQGRLLASGDNENIGAHPVAVISHRYWHRRFAGRADVIGRKIRLNGISFSIVGVAPENFRGVWLESPADVWIPIVMQSDVHYAQNFSSHQDADPEKPWPPQEFVEWLDVLVRVKPTSAFAVRDVLNSAFLRSQDDITGHLAADARRYFLERSLTLDPFRRGASNLRQRWTSPLFAMMAMVGLVLLIACANAANLLLARAEGRRREIAVRLSIGASRGRLIQQLLTESFLLVAAATVLGLLLARWASDALVRMAVGSVTGPTPFTTGVDEHVLMFAIGMSVITGVLFSLAPALRATRLEIGDAMKTSSRSAFTGSRFSAAKLLVAAQVALSLLVVCGAGLFARSLRNLAQQDLGFDREHVLTVWMDPRSAGYGAAQLPGLYRRLVERVQIVPGVRSAAVSMCGLVVECRDVTGGVKISGYQPAPGEDVRIQYNFAGPGYFSTVGMHLLSGRDFTSRDSGSRFVIVNQATVRRYFANRNPLGQRFGENLESEIIGVVQDARVNRVREPAVPMAYCPLEGNLVYAGSLEVRAAGNPSAIAIDVRKALHDIAPDLPIERITPLELQVDRSLNLERMGTVVTSAFGVLALGLACFGLYGVMSYAVSRRTSEIGVRMALGAQPANVLWAILKEALALVALGLAIGVPAAILASRSIAALLYGIQPNDPVTLLSTIVILTSVAVFAGLWPAWRASRVNPLAALRHE